MTGIEIAFLAIGLFLFTAAIIYFAISLYRDRKTYQLIQAIDRNADAKTIKQLLSQGARVNPGPSLVQRLLRRLTNTEMGERTPLRQALPERKAASSATASNNGVATPSHPEMVVKDLLTFAIQKKATQAATVLIERGAKVNPKTKTRDTQILPLSQFFQFPYQSNETAWHALGELLLAKGDVNGNIGFLSPLLFAARNKFPIEWIQKLIDKGAFVNPFYPDKAHAFPNGVSFPEVTETQPFAYGPTPLIWAVLQAETDLAYGVALWKLLIVQPGIHLHSIPAGTDFPTDYKECKAPLTLAVDKKMVAALEQFLTPNVRPIYSEEEIVLSPSKNAKHYSEIRRIHRMFQRIYDEPAEKIWDLMLRNHYQPQNAGLSHFGVQSLGLGLLHNAIGDAKPKFVALILKYADIDLPMLTDLLNICDFFDSRAFFYADPDCTEPPSVTTYELALFLSKSVFSRQEHREPLPRYQEILKLVQAKMEALGIPLTRSKPQTYYMRYYIRGLEMIAVVHSLDAEACLKAVRPVQLPSTTLPDDEAKAIQDFVLNKNLNPYEVLEINETDALSDNVIKAAFRSVTLKYHADKNLNSAVPFDGSYAQLARDILREPAKLQYYNQLRA